MVKLSSARLRGSGDVRIITQTENALAARSDPVGERTSVIRNVQVRGTTKGSGHKF